MNIPILVLNRLKTPDSQLQRYEWRHRCEGHLNCFSGVFKKWNWNWKHIKIWFTFKWLFFYCFVFQFFVACYILSCLVSQIPAERGHKHNLLPGWCSPLLVALMKGNVAEVNSITCSQIIKIKMKDKVKVKTKKAYSRIEQVKFVADSL